MSVSSTARSAYFTLNQTTSAFPFTFRALTTALSDIKCIVTTNSTDHILTYLTDYTITVSTTGVGGTVNLISPTTLSKGTLTVYRETTNKQESDYDDYNQFPADTLETDLDRRTLISQEQAESLTRTLLLSISVSGATTTLPAPVSNKVLGWNAGATAIENKVAIDADVASAASSSATVALAAQSAASSSASAAASSATAASVSTTAAASHATTALSASTTAVKNDGTVNPTNLLSNGDFESWSAGTSAAPDGWTVSGTVAREATTIKQGTYSAKLTTAGGGGGSAYIYNGTIHTEKGIAYWKSRTITFSVWVNASDANFVRIQGSDGVTNTFSSYHTGGGAYELLTLTKTIAATATYIEFYVISGSAVSKSFYVDGAMLVEGGSAFAFSDKPIGTPVPTYSTNCAFTASSGPTFASTTIVGWLSVNINGTQRFIPYW